MEHFTVNFLFFVIFMLTFVTAIKVINMKFKLTVLENISKSEPNRSLIAICLMGLFCFGVLHVA